MSLSAVSALRVVSVLLALSIALASIELLLVRRDFGQAGVFSWRVIRDDVAALPGPLRALLDGLLGDRPFVALLVLQLGLALLLPWSTHALVPLGLLCTGLCVCVRFRGTYNGGSDAMALVVVLGLLVARLGPPGSHDDLAFGSPWQRAGLGYIAAQLVLSYFLAGLAKLREPRWRRGQALPRLLRAHQYAVPAALQRALASPVRALPASWLVMLFECCFPAALWLGPEGCAAVLTCGMTFHLLNAAALGLNRFFWAWLAAYPALLFWSGILAGKDP